MFSTFETISFSINFKLAPRATEEEISPMHDFTHLTPHCGLRDHQKDLRYHPSNCLISKPLLVEATKKKREKKKKKKLNPFLILATLNPFDRSESESRKNQDLWK